jgi:hypothetical protein
MKRLTNIPKVLLILMFLSNFSWAQTLEKYSGPYNWGNNDGTAEYTFFNQQGKRIFNGDFKFMYKNQSSKGFLELNISGHFVNGEVNGYWEISLGGKLQGYAINQKLIGNFKNGVPHGLFSRDFSFANETIKTSVTYSDGLFTGSFQHSDSDKQKSIKADFSTKGYLKDRIVQIENNETIELYFDEKDIASLFVGLINGEEVKRVDLKAAFKDLDPSYISTDTIDFVDGNTLLDELWGEGNFGHLNGKGSLNINKYNKMKYVQYQKLNSLKDAGFTSIDKWQLIDPRTPHLQEENLKNIANFKESYSLPPPEKNKYIVQKEILYVDTISKLYASVSTKEIEALHETLKVKLVKSRYSLKGILNAHDDLVELIAKIQTAAVETIGILELPKMVELEEIKTAIDAHASRFNVVENNSNKAYALIDWKNELNRLQQIIEKEDWIVIDTLTSFHESLLNYYNINIIPLMTKNIEIQKLLLEAKDAEELTRIMVILNEDIKLNFGKLNLNSIPNVFDDLVNVQNALYKILQNPSENYKPIKKELKDSNSAAEIRNLLNI